MSGNKMMVKMVLYEILIIKMVMMIKYRNNEKCREDTGIYGHKHTMNQYLLDDFCSLQ